jgi:iron complex outermembrane receptor protein
VFGSYGHHFITDGFRSTDDTTGVRGSQTFVVRPNLLAEFGVDIAHYGGEAHSQPGPFSWGTHHVEEQAGFSRWQWNPSRRLRLNAGYRYQANSQFGSLNVPEAGGVYTLTNRVSVAFNASRGFRNPTLRELYLFPAPNPNLEPETMWNYETSLRVQAARRLRVSSTFYYADLRDIIVTLGRYPNMTLLNAGSAINRGMEFSGEWTTARRIRLQGGYAYLRSTNPQVLVPRNKVNYSLSLPLRKSNLDFSGISAGRRPGNVARTVYLDAYSNARLRLSHPLNEHLTVFAMVDNLFNQSYEYLPGYPMPGISAVGGFTWKM